jgi:hypothetical protein
MGTAYRKNKATFHASPNQRLPVSRPCPPWQFSSAAPPRQRLVNAGGGQAGRAPGRRRRPGALRTFAWEDKVERLSLQFEHIQQYYRLKLMACTLINLRAFCGV